MSSLPKHNSEREEIRRGETNCPKYRLAERSGITVVAETRPPFMDAIVFRYGTPTPLPTPINIEATISEIGVMQIDIIAYPPKKNSGAKYFKLRLNICIQKPKDKPTKKAIKSSPTIISVTVFVLRLVANFEVIAKFVG